MDDPTLIILFWGVIGALVGLFIGDAKGRTGAGVVLGFLLGPIGWLIIGIGPNYKEAADTKKCPFCAERVKREGKVCKHCRRDLGPIRRQAA